jgi:cell division protein FtsN
MARDYAKRYKTPQKKRRKSAFSVYVRRLVVLGIILLLIMLGTAGYYYLQRPDSPLSAALLSKVSRAKAISVKKTPSKAVAITPKEEPVEYEFYTLLPKINVPDSTQSNTSAAEQPGYWLQIAVYYSMRDASAMVDKLQLLGLDPAVATRKSTKADRTLYVVMIGPHSSKQAAISHQQELKKINITSYIFHIDPPVAVSATTILV